MDKEGLSRDEIQYVPKVVHESAMARADNREAELVKAIRRIVITALAIFLLNNLAWLYAWLQYDYESTETVTVDGKDGIASYIGNDGDIYNGESDSYKDEETEEEKRQVARD